MVCFPLLIFFSQALTLLLSVGLTRLTYLCLDASADAKLHEELSRACRPNPGGVDPEVEAGTQITSIGLKMQGLKSNSLFFQSLGMFEVCFWSFACI